MQLFSFYQIGLLEKVIVKGDILIKLVICVLLPITILYPNMILIVILLTGILNPFNTMAQLEMLRNDTVPINVPQKELVVNLISYFAHMLSGYILLNINSNIAIIIIVFILGISVIGEAMMYKNVKKA